MKIMFMGTPDFAAECLQKVLDSGHEVVAVLTQPDRALKRGKTEASPVKTLASARGITILQPEKISVIAHTLSEYGADIGVTAAYGQLLDRAVLESFRYGVINVHASLLPKYRGASPVQSAIMNGETETGVTIMQTELGLDSGDILAVAKTNIGEKETGGELMKRLSELGGELLVETLDNFDAITPVPQRAELATRCTTIKKSEEYIDFSSDCKTVVDKIRALCPVPCAKTAVLGDVYKIYAAETVDAEGEAGEILRSDDPLVIACGSGAVSILKIQAPGKRALDIAEFLRGKKLPVGAVCGKI